MRPRKKIRLGDLLVENKIISTRQLESALEEQRASGRKLGRVLVDNGYIKEANLLQFLARQLQVPYVELGQHNFDPAVVRLIPEMIARRFRSVALYEREGVLTVGMADPTDIFAYDEIARVLRRSFTPAVVSETELLRLFDGLYRKTEEIESYAEALNEELSERDLDLGQLLSNVEDDVSEAPVVRLIHSLFEDAMQVGASDVHVEPGENSLRIRLRVDGLLQEQVMEEFRIASALVLRLKLMAGLDISEKRLPQDGRFSVKIKGRKVDVRMSTMPLQDGEGVVMRLLDQSAGVLNLHNLGMPTETLGILDQALTRNQGMVLVTGPTGSGKTTTIYSALAVLNRADTKILTVEDPVEYRLDRINQIQVNPDIGLTFPKVLRGVLRLDPDVVFIGEMRDEETVSIGMRAAMTGHLVLSTLHTNDAVSAVTRLVDLGAEGFALGSTLNLVVGQRLVRKLCENCLRPVDNLSATGRWLLKQAAAANVSDVTLMAPCGCGQCQGTGYRGRTGIHEALVIDDDLVNALANRDITRFRQLASQQLEGRSLVDAAMALMAAGKTSVDEVVRVIGFDGGLKTLGSQGGKATFARIA